MGIEVASTEPLFRPALRTLDQSCAGIHTPCHHTYRAIELNVCSEQACSLLRLYDSSGRSSSSSSVVESSTTSSGTSISVVVISPPGTGIIVSPLGIELSLGLPKPDLLMRCDA